MFLVSVLGSEGTRNRLCITVFLHRLFYSADSSIGYLLTWNPKSHTWKIAWRIIFEFLTKLAANCFWLRESVHRSGLACPFSPFRPFGSMGDMRKKKASEERHQQEFLRYWIECTGILPESTWGTSFGPSVRRSVTRSNGSVVVPGIDALSGKEGKLFCLERHTPSHWLDGRRSSSSREAWLFPLAHYTRFEIFIVWLIYARCTW